MKTKNNTNFNIGNRVKVKEGIMCPDLEGLCIEGWQGTILEIEEAEEDGKDLVCIEWDNATLEKMPRYFIDQSEEEGLEHKLMYLYIDEVQIIGI